MVYLFIGEDSLSKEAQLKKIRQEVLPKETEQFNLDILYAKDLSLKLLQERFLSLPVKSRYRIIIIKDVKLLKEDSRNFIKEYVKKPFKQIVLILDADRYDRKDAFLTGLEKCTKTIRFKESFKPSTFTLENRISLRKPDQALKVLNDLLDEGERPERILGGLRYAWERNLAHPQQMQKRLKLLLNCDIEIKTGRLKPQFALEKLVLSLCGFSKSF